jgi:hypothetical protein
MTKKVKTCQIRIIETGEILTARNHGPMYITAAGLWLHRSKVRLIKVND